MKMVSFEWAVIPDLIRTKFEQFINKKSFSFELMKMN